MAAKAYLSGSDEINARANASLRNSLNVTEKDINLNASMNQELKQSIVLIDHQRNSVPCNILEPADIPSTFVKNGGDSPERQHKKVISIVNYQEVAKP